MVLTAGLDEHALGPDASLLVGVDDLSFNVAASVAGAHQIIDAYKQGDVGPERTLIKARG